ncbi:endonuclease/exonuclease/phosphatase family protein [Leifsonia sp. ZF2019]|uniref:endonuclease/exonuclease/phosphatase family protein n=1 Tax=Leifsonia sp. ZF2019 TaxID=2781978 RepID=UPI001CBC5A5C|nr:endonuclease/exonuclease/phosphatase family protein [Leifsonia sp. ZF2019]UAJ80798.1 endonuclease/exonuclease/phosphatase family protein [Leifsonia sp. ZF2019]
MRCIPLRIVSYNLRKHAAGHELADIALTHDVDALCLQEADTDVLPQRLHHLGLADATRANRLGLAMYVRDDRYEVLHTQVFAVNKSLHDRVLAPAHERLLAVHLRDRDSGDSVLVGSFHAAPLTASNSLRRKQIAAAHEGMRSIAPGTPAIMVGDFNYPWFINGLERSLTTSGYTLKRSTEPTYLRYKFFTGYFDFVTSTGFDIERVDVLPAGASDHRAISLEAERAA